jgi:hypothetical protein
MMDLLRFIPKVEDDVAKGYAWYERKRPGLGDEFLRAFYTCMEDLPRIHVLTRKSMEKSGVVCSGGSLTRFITSL